MHGRKNIKKDHIKFAAFMAFYFIIFFHVFWFFFIVLYVVVCCILLFNSVSYVFLL